MNERRIARIEQQIKERVANLLLHELADPRLGFVTISRVEVDKEMNRSLIYWTVLGDEGVRKRTATALEHATGFMRKEVAHILHTRTVPKLEFRFDESVGGALQMQSLLDELRTEREAREGPTDEDEPQGNPDGGADGRE